MTSQEAYKAHAARLGEAAAKREVAERAELVEALHGATKMGGAVAERAELVLANIDTMIAKAGAVRALDMASIGKYIETGRDTYGQPLTF